jgi:hypothetical protein
MTIRRTAVSALVALALATPLSAAVCVNKYIVRSEGPRQVVTLLTGKLTFQDAQALSKAIADKSAQPLEWVDAKGKTVSKMFGDLKVIRPMPVGCDGKTSGVVVIVTFPTGQQPSGTISIKLDANTTVQFEQQKE